MDIQALKAMASVRPSVWIKSGPFDFLVRRISLLEIDRINRESNDYMQVGELVHTVTNEHRLVNLYLSEVKGWKGVQVKHLLELPPDSEYTPEDDVPFDRELLVMLAANYPFVVKDLAAGLMTQAVRYAKELADSKKKSEPSSTTT